MYYFALCAIAKDEDAYIEEWIHFHSIVGVEHFFIYDDGSRTPLSKTLKEYIVSGLATVLRPPQPTDQMRTYTDCLRTHGGRCRWLGFIDVDEYLVPRGVDDIRRLLFMKEEYAGLAVSQVFFCSSGRVSRPAVPQIQAYDECLPYEDAVNKHIKSIVQPKLTKRALTGHNFEYREGFYCVNEDEFPVTSPHGYHTRRTIQLNHYFYRSQQDYEHKISRGVVFARENRRNGAKYTLDQFYRQADLPTIRDETALPFLPALEETLAAKGPTALTARRKQYAQENPQAYINAFSGLISQNAPDAALETLYQAQYAFSGNPVLLLLFAQYAMQRSDLGAAELLLTRSIRLAASPMAYFCLCKVYFALDKKEKARKIALFLKHQMKNIWKDFTPPDDTAERLLPPEV